MNIQELTQAFGRMQHTYLEMRKEINFLKDEREKLNNQVEKLQKADSLKEYDDTDLWRRITEIEKNIQIIKIQIRELGKRTPPKEEKPEKKGWDFLSIFK